ELLHQLAGAVDHLEHVDAFFVAADLVGQAFAAPVVGLVDVPVHARHDRVHLPVKVGDLLLGRVGRKDVDELVLTTCHSALLMDRHIATGHLSVARLTSRRRYSVVAGSPPLNAFITAAIPDVMNISAASAARSVMRSTSAASLLSNFASTWSAMSRWLSPRPT